MEQPAPTIPFDELVASAESVFEQIDEHGSGIHVEHRGKLYSLKPLGRIGAKRRSPRVLTAEDSLFNIVGLIDLRGPTDVSADKHKYIAEGFLELHTP